MHETAVAQSLLVAILAESTKQEAKPVSARISCGTLNTINDELLCFALKAAAKGTPCEAVKLYIEHKPIQAQCKGCKTTYDFDLVKANCPKCNSEDFCLLSDAPLMLEEIEFESEQ